MQPLTRGIYTARLIPGEDDLTEAQVLRHVAFRPGDGGGRDRDDFDALCRHVLVHDEGGTLVACCRLHSFDAQADLSAGYSAQFYDLSRLSAFAGPKLELGRFCLHPSWHDPDILRLTWAMLTAIVDAEDIGLLFGCSSFAGTDPTPHLAALAALKRFVAPEDHAPGPRAHERVALPPGEGQFSALPPLLRTYLAMGGWVSDHAVVDRDMDTLHVFTALETARIPAQRARALRAIVHAVLTPERTTTR
ncbi:MAG: GNAT family N-acetyltransferase [Cypionkella sp.]